MMYRVYIPNASDMQSSHQVFIGINEYLGDILESPRNRRDIIINTNRSLKDPVHGSMANHFMNLFKRPNARSIPLHYDWTLTNEPMTFYIEGFPIVLHRDENRYFLNGQNLTLVRLANVFARIVYKAAFEKDKTVLMKYMMKQMATPENISYVLENRFPFHFFENFEKIEVRLNVVQIDEDECAIEIGDGVWGNISFSNLNTMCNFYIHGKKRGNWKYLSPQELYRRVMNKEPLESDMKVMINFLKQNRQQDIVERRAQDLLNDLARQYPDNIKLDADDGLMVMYVRGRGYDWKLTDSKYKSDIQQVSTYVYQPTLVDVYDENNALTERKMGDADWRGPICIDNMARGSSVGDQFAARALALINDTMTVKMVNTINRYLTAKENEWRIDWDEV